jgi:PPOX class probable F420-dependent enzyme
MSDSSILTQQVRDLLTSGRLAHLVTINPDGSPQMSVVWVGLDGDEIVSGHLGDRQKLRNVRRDPRVALSLDAAHLTRWAWASTSSCTARAGSPRAARPICCNVPAVEADAPCLSL